jgi:hypothetical protein
MKPLGKLRKIKLLLQGFKVSETLHSRWSLQRILMGHGVDKWKDKINAFMLLDINASEQGRVDIRRPAHIE